MKLFFLAVSLSTISFAACNSGETNSTTASTKKDRTVPASTAQYVPPVGIDAKVSASIKPVVSAYLKLKNALTADKGADAAAAGKSMLDALAGVDTSAMTTAQKSVYANLLDDMSEHAEHTSKNGSNIAHQREHFEMLSKDVYDLVKTFGGGQKLYYAHCPMAFDNKGASWVSEFEEIKNPYFGDQMLECGEVKEELK